MPSRSSLTRLTGSLLLACLAAAGLSAVDAGPLGRDHSPVVVEAAELPGLSGKDPARIVAFRFDGGWQAVPVQVDERAYVDFGQIYGDAPTGQTVLTFTDPGTFTGADPDAGLDDDDHVVLRAADAAARHDGSPDPAGTLPGTRQELRVSDPLTGRQAWLYLFESDGSLDPAAGVAPIDYDFVLLSGDYKSTYGTEFGPNPEDSTVTTGSYQVHFSDRWIRDVTAVTDGGAPGTDFLDRHKNLFKPGDCARSEDTFSAGEGAFIVNRSGPVRALRGYVGANSGPTTYRIHEFYETREHILTALRVHPIDGVMDYLDYSAAASGMRYHNDAHTAGFDVDGTHDTVPEAQLRWEMITGAQGTLAHAWMLDVDIPGFDYTSFYSDNETPFTIQCTGDDSEYGASGIREDDAIPNTDPAGAEQWGELYRFEVRRVIRYGPPDRDIAFAATHYDEVANPVAVLVNPGAACPDLDGDGLAVCDGSCTPDAGDVCGDCNDLFQACTDDCADPDADGIPTCAEDNCPSWANPGQEDGDEDGAGDVCDVCPADPLDDADLDGVCGDVDAFPDDPLRAGPLFAGTVDAIDEVTRTVGLPHRYINPVVILGPPTRHDPAPGVARLDRVLGTSFDVRFDEWIYLDGVREAPESAAFLVIERGRYTMEDGSVWEAGQFELSGNRNFSAVQFEAPFSSAPALLLTAQTSRGGQPVTVRARNVTATGFEAALYEEEWLVDGHVPEQVGYLALVSPAGSGRVEVDGSPAPYHTVSLRVDHRRTPLLAWSLVFEEEASRDAETVHADETVAALVLGKRLFAQEVSSTGPDTGALRRYDPEFPAPMEWGVLEGVSHRWTTVPLARLYASPVVILEPASNSGAQPGVGRVRNAGSDAFEVRFQEWSYLDDAHRPERMFYMVVETGRHELAGLTVEAGRLSTGATVQQGAWDRVDFALPFVAAPAVFSSVQTVAGFDAVTTRVRGRDAGGFEISLQEEEAAVDGHKVEDVGWVAIDEGAGTTEDGRAVEVLRAEVDHNVRTVPFEAAFAGRFPLVVAGAATTRGPDPCTLRHARVTPQGIDVYVEEERSRDDEVDHAVEEACLFVAE